MQFDDKMHIPDVSAFDFGEPDGQSGAVLHHPIGLANASAPEFIRGPNQSLPKTRPLARFDASMLDAIRSDPYLAPRLDELRDRVQQDFLAAVDQSLAAFPKDAARPSAVNLNSAPVSGRRLMIDSRRGELADKSRRALVQATAVEAVFNLDNPDWDPARPETSRETPNLLLALLRDK